MIIVTGGTGLLGSQIVDRLLERVPAARVGVSVRDIDRAGELAARGVRVRRGDFTDPSSLAEAFEGANQVLIVSANLTGEAAVAAHVAAIDAARAAGAGRILYTSHQAAAEDSVFEPMPDHAATERYLAAAGIPFTALRNGFYAGTVPLLLGSALDTGELIAPADGPVSWTAHADLAEAAAIILADEDRFDGPTPPLTAPEALDLADIAAILTEQSGRTIRRVVAEDSEWAASLVAHGVPEERAAMLLGMFRAARRGEFATTTGHLESLLQHPAIPVSSILSAATTR
ncbi:NmrA family NAD(P)-binding protein [Nocardia gamkensis]|uniref:NmrA family NAD(P)-binding protein n=1 Tax=Nocardia gamkensis TaxID=352869 RepID=A0A7X6L912_9NOCA|nr:NmrA family NAD(P)-binding protein [Nocardia gamkensis]NKY29870.1 NmrA family NAD(P)-binding protein [Nocardia gamkensis]NQE69936.1 Quinone oxidoreductase 2 [Nocardia gamkensis]